MTHYDFLEDRYDTVQACDQRRVAIPPVPGAEMGTYLTRL